nr:hypothetical protein BaRGS_000233 [Batillaria attramentaria]
MFSCLYESGISEVNSVAMVTSCPEEWQGEDVSQLCHNVTDDNDFMQRLPVSGTVTRVLYRNMYCAICHQEEFVYWVPSINCSFHDELPFHANSSFAEAIARSSNCSLHFQPHDSHFGWRPCLDNDVTISSECSATFPMDSEINREIAARCQGDGNVGRMVYGYIWAYRNQYCAMCNHENSTGLFCGQSLVVGPNVDKATRAKLPYSFSILLDINTHSGSSTVGIHHVQRTVQRNQDLTCDVGHVYDPFKDVCRPVTCGPGRRFRDNKCVMMASDNLRTGGSVGGRLDCPIPVKLNETEFRLHEDGTLELLGVNVFYNESQYSLTRSGAFVCVNYSQNYSRQVEDDVMDTTFTFSVAEAVVSSCGICVSLLAMAVTIGVYASLRPLRNIPGQNLLSLVTALFLADLLLLLAPSAGEVPVACAVVAGVMHYLFLAAFVWMNVMALDVWFTFSKVFVKAGDRGKSSKRFVIYSAYAWLTPALFVTSAGLIQALDPESSVSPRYGQGICWLSNKFALLVFFASPLFLLLLLNAVFFVISARNIARARRTSARMLGKEEEGRMGIYVKLTVVMGLTWVFGFLAALVPNQILTYSFVVMNTLQGLFIFLSFVLNKRVLGLLKDKFHRKRVKVIKSVHHCDMIGIGITEEKP